MRAPIKMVPDVIMSQIFPVCNLSNYIALQDVEPTSHSQLRDYRGGRYCFFGAVEHHHRGDGCGQIDTLGRVGFAVRS